MAARTRRDWPFVFDPGSSMPRVVQERHHEWCVAARDCYQRRDEAGETGQAALAVAYFECGDIYFERALAIGAEWEKVGS